MGWSGQVIWRLGARLERMEGIFFAFYMAMWSESWPGEMTQISIASIKNSALISRCRALKFVIYRSKASSMEQCQRRIGSFIKIQILYSVCRIAYHSLFRTN